MLGAPQNWVKQQRKGSFFNVECDRRQFTNSTAHLTDSFLAMPRIGDAKRGDSSMASGTAQWYLFTGTSFPITHPSPTSFCLSPTTLSFPSPTPILSNFLSLLHNPSDTSTAKVIEAYFFLHRYDILQSVDQFLCRDFLSLPRSNPPLAAGYLQQPIRIPNNTYKKFPDKPTRWSSKFYPFCAPLLCIKSFYHIESSVWALRSSYLHIVAVSASSQVLTYLPALPSKRYATASPTMLAESSFFSPNGYTDHAL